MLVFFPLSLLSSPPSRSTVSCNAPWKSRALYGTGRQQQLLLCSNTSACVFCWAAPCQEGQIGLLGCSGWKMSDSWCSGVASGQSSHRLLYLTGQQSVPTFRALCVSRMGNSIWVEREGHSLTLTFKLMIYELVCVMQPWVGWKCTLTGERAAGWRDDATDWCRATAIILLFIFSVIHIHWNVETAAILSDMSSMNCAVNSESMKNIFSLESQPNRHLHANTYCIYLFISNYPIGM